MNYIIKDSTVVIITDNYKVELPKKTFSKVLLNEAILQELNFKDLLKIWRDLYGVPGNIKEFLKKKIELYNSSSNVNSFMYQDQEYWLDKHNRSNLQNLSSSSLGDIEFILGDKIITINSLKLKAFLVKLEVYAYKCHVNTFKHLLAIKELKTVEDIINYDYTKGYPEKITFNYE